MSDRRAHNPGDPGMDDALATMNDHLARFFQHADSLLHEWQAYGDQLRASLDTEVQELRATVARSVAEAGREASEELHEHIDRALGRAVDRTVSQTVDRSLASSVAAVRGEVENLARLVQHAAARVPAGAPGEPARGARARQEQGPDERGARPWTSSGALLLAITTANVMLAVLLVMNARGCQSSDPRAGAAAPGQKATATASDPDTSGPSGAGIDAGGRPDAAAAHPGCAPLAQGYDADAARGFIAASARALCGDSRAPMVIESLVSRLDSESKEAEPAGDKKSGKGSSGRERSDKKRSRSRSEKPSRPRRRRDKR